jgi:hypothetical protein
MDGRGSGCHRDLVFVESRLDSSAKLTGYGIRMARTNLLNDSQNDLLA